MTATQRSLSSGFLNLPQSPPYCHPPWPFSAHLPDWKGASVTGSSLSLLPLTHIALLLCTRHCVSAMKLMVLMTLFFNNPLTSRGTYFNAISPAFRSLMLLRYIKATQSMLLLLIYLFKLRDLNLKFLSRTGIHKSMKHIFRMINYEVITQVSQLQE